MHAFHVVHRDDHKIMSAPQISSSKPNSTSSADTVFQPRNSLDALLAQSHDDSGADSARCPTPSLLGTFSLASQQTGARQYSDGRDATYVQTGLPRLMARLTLLLFMAWVYILNMLLIWAWFSRVGTAVTAVVFLGGLLTPARALLWQPFLDCWLFRIWRDYFNYSIVFDSPMDLSKNYIFAMYPHGVWPLSQFIATSTYKDAFSGHSIYMVVASSLFAVPMWRHIMTWVGAAPATATEFRNLLKLGSVAVMPEGIAGMYQQQACREQIKMSGHTGFIRMALETGVDLVPVYHFGNSCLLDMWPRSLEPWCRRWRMFFGAVRGMWNLPVPRQVPLMMVVGPPISVHRMTRDAPGAEEEVQRLRSELQEAVSTLYNKYRGMYSHSWQERPLLIT